MNSCTTPKINKFDQIYYNEKIAKIVNSVANGIINPDSDIIVKFQKPVVTKDQVGKIVKNNIFIFEPGIKGKISWESTDTLVFKPDSGLKNNILYHGSIDLGRIIEKEDEILKFNFIAKQINIKNYSYEFISGNDSNSNNVIFQAR